MSLRAPRLSVLMVSQVFPPEIGACRMIYGCARSLVALGHDVSVIAGLPNYPDGIIREGYRGRLRMRERLDGDLDVVRTFLVPSSNATPRRRLLTFASFLASALLEGLSWRKRFDVVLSVSPPLTVGLAGLWIARLRRIPFALYMLDLEPESAIALGHFQDGLFVRTAERISNHLYARARMLFVFSEGSRGILTERRGVDPAKVRVLTGGVDTELFRPKDPDPAHARELGCEGKLVVMYTGTFGRLQHLATILEAARALRGRNGVQFVLVGDGEERVKLEALRRELALEQSVLIVPPRPTEEVPDLLALADVCVTNVRRAELHDGIVPAKILEYLACGRAIVAGIGGESRRILENEGAGIAVPPEDAAALAAAVAELAADPGRRARMGAAGRRLAVERFSREQVAATLQEGLIRAVRSG